MFVKQGWPFISDLEPRQIDPQAPRAAASLLVVREEEGVVRVLMGRRSAHHRFMPNVLVFPGGAVDEADHHASVATPLKPSVRLRLERAASPSLAQALAVAAARELEEEVGLTLGSPPRLAHLDYLCRAITPPDRSIRFDARFFIIDSAFVQGDPRASDEIEAPGWYEVEEALKQPIALATQAVLGQFSRWLANHDRGGPVATLENRVWVSK